MEGKITYTTQVYTGIFPVGTQDFDVDIYCPFTPDIITFSNLVSTIPATSVDNDLYVLSSNLISSMDNVVGVFQPNNNIMSTEISFQNSRTISGKFKFTLDLPIAIVNTQLTFVMTFTKL